LLVPTDAWYRQVHDRLLQGDPTASADCAGAVIGPLTKRLERRFPELRGSDVLADAVTDAVFSYLKRPEQYDPSKRGLLGYLAMAAEGDLKNALAKGRRRKEMELPLEDVDLDTVAGNMVVGPGDPAGEVDVEEIRSGVSAMFDDPRDRQLAELVLDGERSVDLFARILKLENLPIDEQRREVKRHKDRIKKRLERYGQGIRRRGQE
jgi:RNA polymerase sigma-70 factor (ECF subfamily)